MSQENQFRIHFVQMLIHYRENFSDTFYSNVFNKINQSSLDDINKRLKDLITILNTVDQSTTSSQLEIISNNIANAELALAKTLDVDTMEDVITVIENIVETVYGESLLSDFNESLDRHDEDDEDDEDYETKE